MQAKIGLLLQEQSDQVCNVCHCVYTIKLVLSEHIKQDIFLAFQAGGCLLLHESSAESSCGTFIQQYLSSHLSIGISMSPEWMVALNRFNCTFLIPHSIAKLLCAHF